ncbi:MAG: UDP-glucose 4-epimerase GalE [Clostridiales bacterium]|nr:UDP-glucose 4-epimerase GalE [Clostridiales bacterium]
MNLLVTGGAGYIGSHFTKAALECGHRVSIIDNLSTGNSFALDALRHLANSKGKSACINCKALFSFYRGCYGDKKLIEEIFKTNQTDAVIHLAASSLVSESLKNPEKYYQDIQLTRNLVDMMKKHSIYKLVFSSSAAVYGRPQSVPITEDSPISPVSPYGEAKAFIEKMLWEFASKNTEEDYKLNFVALRYFNACGAAADSSLGESHKPETHLIPRLLLSAADATPRCQIYGSDYPTADGTCVRDYIHVEDIASAHLQALKLLCSNTANTSDGQVSGEIINLGTGQGFSILEIIKTVGSLTGKPFEKQFFGRREGDPAILIASNKKAFDILSWSPRYTKIEDMLATAWQWHKKTGCP